MQDEGSDRGRSWPLQLSSLGIGAICRSSSKGHGGERKSERDGENSERERKRGGGGRAGEKKQEGEREMKRDIPRKHRKWRRTRGTTDGGVGRKNENKNKNEK